MDWSTVGNFLKNNAGAGVGLVGSLLTGNIPGAIAAGVAMVSSATGTADPAQALQTLQTDPATLVRLKEIAQQEAESTREHIRAMAQMDAQDAQAAQAEQQATIRAGDTAPDEYVRRTRPRMARQSWYVGAGYIVAFEALKSVDLFHIGASVEFAMVLLAPAAAYIGFRSWDKWGSAKFEK